MDPNSSVADSTRGVARQETSAFTIVASCAALFVLAVSQPVLDLIGANPEFFLARDAPQADIVGLALILGLVIPLIVGGVVAAIGRLSESAGRVAYVLVVAALGALLAFQLIQRVLSSFPEWAQLGIAAVVGCLLGYAVGRWRPVQSTLSVAGIAVLVVPITFLFLSPTSELVLESGSAVGAGGAPVGAPAPVVMLVFDELPLASLVGGDGEIQEDLYPGFARLADDATWFRNAITVQRLTQFSIPAMLSGVNPEPDFIPTTVDYPQNLFTLLGDSYDMHAMESLTGLCPASACREPDAVVPSGQRWKTTFDDLAVVAGHVILPASLTNNLPPIDENWAGFAAQAIEVEDAARLSTNEELRDIMRAEVAAGRGATIEQFIQSIEPPRDRPTLHFAHVLLPHAPWEYLPRGQRYILPVGLSRSQGGDEWLVHQGYQRHLVQTMYVDHVVETLLDRLKSIGTYDEAVVVVASDHGIVFNPGTENPRVATSDSIGGLAAVPLFIKAPGLTRGHIDDFRAETVDVLPTIADALDVEISWDVDGTSLIDPSRPVRTESVITGGGTVTFGADGNEMFEVAKEKVAIFGEEGPFALAPEGAEEFLGMDLRDLDIRRGSGDAGSLLEPGLFDDVNTSDAFLPAMVQGIIIAPSSEGHSIILVGINGVVAAVTRTFVDDDGVTRFYALVPPSALRDGDNDVVILMRDESAASPTFFDIAP
jgi:Sulfatase